MKSCRWLMVVVLALMALGARAETLTVSAAASLTEAFKAIGSRFEAQHPGVQLRFNFAASGVLLAQIDAGAPVDVFASADQETMDRAEKKQLLLPGSRRDFTANRLVLVTPLAETKLTRLSDLSAASVRRIAIGKPASVPAGRYAQQALQALELWEPLQAKLVFADNVRQVLDYVARGEVEAGFVYASDAALFADKVRSAAPVAGHRAISYPAAVVRDSRQAQRADQFVRFLVNGESQAIFHRLGFSAK